MFPQASVKDSGSTLDTKDAAPMLVSVGDSGQFEAYFATFGVVDRAKEAIAPGAFVGLDEFAKQGWVGLNHQMEAAAVAYPVRVEQDSVGLRVACKFHNTPAAQAVRSIIKDRFDAGLDVCCSIGYKTEKSHQARINGEDVKVLDRVRLFEVSLVNLPANSDATVISVKAGRGNVMRIEKSLDALATEYRRAMQAVDVELKAGRRISAATHANLRDVHKNLRSAAAALASVGGFDESLQRPIGDDGRDDDKDVDPRRVAGNAIPGQGSPTADDMSKAARLNRLQMKLAERRLADRYGTTERDSLLIRQDLPAAIKAMEWSQVRQADGDRLRALAEEATR